MNAAPAIQLAGVVKDYVTDWRSGRWRALDDVTLAVPRGALCALVGPNGAGKSTALKICAGLTWADAGTCVIDGRAPVDAARAGAIGYLAERDGLPDHLSVQAALAGLAELSGLTRSEAQSAASRALGSVRLTDCARRRVGALSKGQRQRLGLAQAALTNPGILLLDEPAAGLDPRATVQLAELLAEQRAAGRTIMLTSHFLPEVEAACDYFVLLDQGRVIFAGGRAAVQAHGGLSRAYLEMTASP